MLLRKVLADIDRHSFVDRTARTHNIGLAIWRLTCLYETFMQDSAFVLRMKFIAKNPPHRQAENR